MFVAFEENNKKSSDYLCIMTLYFQHNLASALKNIERLEHYEFLVSGEIDSQLTESYGMAKWKIVDLLNEKFSKVLKDKFDLYNWLNYNENDELAYFLNEAGSNCLNYSEFKMPHKFHLWVGKKGFVVGIEQKGKGFNAEEVHNFRIKDGEGAAFDFYRKAKSKIFFDDCKNARMVLMEFMF